MWKSVKVLARYASLGQQTKLLPWAQVANSTSWLAGGDKLKSRCASKSEKAALDGRQHYTLCAVWGGPRCSL
eukprot:4164061-Amphidinium_carterae.2